MIKPLSIFRTCRRPAGYLTAVAELGRHMTPGTVAVATVAHDADCRRPQGGPCICAPNVTMRPLTDPESH